MINLIVLRDRFSIIQLDAGQKIPDSVFQHDFYSITKSEDEISIIVNRLIDIPSSRRSDGWRGFKVEGILDFSLVGIINDITTPLKKNGISVFVTSTYNTDYLFVTESSFERTIEILGNTPDIELTL